MDDKLKLGIPDDEAASAPRQRFRSDERASWLARALLPFTAVLWGGLASRFFGGEEALADTRGEDRGAPPHEPEAPTGPRHPPAMLDAPEMAPTRAPEQEDGPPGFAENVVPFPMQRHLSPSRALSRVHEREAVIATDDETFFFPQNSAGRPERGQPAPPATPPEIPTSAGTGSGVERAAAENADAQTERNHRPQLRGPVRLAPGRSDEAVILTAAVLLAGAIDPDGDPLHVEDLAVEGGTVLARGDGSWLFTPEQGFAGEVTFSYRISDGEESVAQIARADFLPAPGRDVSGGPGDDLLTGTPRGDAMRGYGGHDILYGREGADMLDGGDGNDVLLGGAGDDVIYGGTGDDLVFAGAGNDIVFGGAGDDTLHGGDGDDLLDGGAGDDVLAGDAGSDTLIGGEGDDRLDGGAGADALSGGAGEDRFLIAQAEECDGDSYDGGEGEDTLDFSAIAADARVDLRSGTFEVEGGQGTLVGIERVAAGAGDDCLIADEDANTFSGGAGEDRFVFTSVRSLTNDGAGNDRITDFEPGDRIDFSQLDPGGEGYAARKLYFAGGGDAPPEAEGAVFCVYEQQDGDGSELTLVRGRLGPGGEDEDAYDFEIELEGHHDMTEQDFVFDGDALS